MPYSDPARYKAYQQEYRRTHKAHLTAYRQTWLDARPGYDRRRQQHRRQEACEVIHAYKVTHPCIDCGEADPVVLDFDHVHGNKQFSIAQYRGRPTVSMEHLQAEIAKCEVRCANCHRRATYRRQHAVTV